MVSRVLHDRPRVRLGCACATVSSLVLYVVGALWNHMHPDAQYLRAAPDFPDDTHMQWHMGLLPSQRILFCLTTFLLVTPELLATTHLFLVTRAACRATQVTTSSTSVQAGVQADGEEPTGTDEVMAATVASTSGVQPARSSFRERCYLLLMLLLVLGSFGAAMFWRNATERRLDAVNEAPWLTSQRRFLVAFSGSMATDVTVACDARGVLTANTSADCLLLAVNCVNDTKLTGLNLRGQGMFGRIPEAVVGRIPEHLRSLNLGNNVLDGTLPTSIGQLSSLEQLLLDGNRLTGPLPSELGNLTKLTTCLLTRNDEWINYPDNDFDCTLPDSLPLVCGGDGGNVSVSPQLRCHPPFPPPPPSHPPGWYPPGWY